MDESLATLRAERDWLRYCVDVLNGWRLPQPDPPVDPAVEARVRVLDALAAGPLSATELWRRVDLAPARRLQVIAELRRAGVLQAPRVGFMGVQRFQLRVRG